MFCFIFLLGHNILGTELIAGLCRCVMFLVLLTDLTSVDDCEQYVLTTEIFHAEGHGFDCLHLIHILLHAFPLPHL
jgi:hypothetical protein